MAKQNENRQPLQVVEQKIKNVVVIDNDGEAMYFVGHREVAKPKLLAAPIGEVVAFSDSGLGGKRHVFTASQIAEVQNMQVADRPDWL